MSTRAAPVPPDLLRARFAEAMSTMYRAEVPLYETLLALVGEVNAEVIAEGGGPASDGGRVDRERHGAIRLGTAAELRLIARAFALLGMAPVGYYDLAPAGLPVHATAFRPTGATALTASPLRIFTSLLRVELIEPTWLRDEAQAILARRSILDDEASALLAAGERRRGLGDAESERFVAALLKTFRWRADASVPADLYATLAASHRLVADVVGFRGPHINHLTPRVLDIDRAQARMAARGMTPKAVIEGPPRRACPVLLRQTSFKALDEAIAFPRADGTLETGVHSARFGEIEQRGLALTREGRACYDLALASGGDLHDLLPDDGEELRRERLGFFRYCATEAGRAAAAARRLVPDLDRLVADGHAAAEPILYEDFLPVSAAGIFRSNLGEAAATRIGAHGDRATLAAAIGRPIVDEFALYAEEQDERARDGGRARPNEWIAEEINRPKTDIALCAPPFTKFRNPSAGCDRSRVTPPAIFGERPWPPPGDGIDADPPRTCCVPLLRVRKGRTHLHERKGRPDRTALPIHKRLALQPA